MFYRVDYALAVLFLGFVVGLLFSKQGQNIESPLLARGYYAAVALLLVLRTIVSAHNLLGSPTHFWTTTAGLVGDVLGFLFAALFGLAARRTNPREFLTDSSVLGALGMALAFTFALAGVGKAFPLAPMTDFFVQSGYSLAFLKFIVIAEIFGALDLLPPWARSAALIGLTIDIFGAVLTHVHNGDPPNDSTGAIGLLIRLVAFGLLWTLRTRKPGPPPPIRNSTLAVGAAALACFLIALGGSVAVRHLSPPTAAASQR